MAIDKITWCFNQKNGLKLVEKSEEIKENYFKKIDLDLEDLVLLKRSNNKTWKTTISYYIMYESVYALFRKCGIKSEIHSCTLDIFENIFTTFFTKEDFNLLKQASKARVDLQYYTDRNVSHKDVELFVNMSPKFFLKVKIVSSQLSENDIQNIRNMLGDKK